MKFILFFYRKVPIFGEKAKNDGPSPPNCYEFAIILQYNQKNREIRKVSPGQTVDKLVFEKEEWPPQKSLAEFFASQGEKEIKIRVLRGRVPRKTHVSACQCASVSRKRVRAAGCHLSCRQSQ